MDDNNKHFIEKIKKEEQKKLKPKDKKNTIAWLGMIGIVGWIVILPMMLGLAGGIWIDKHYPNKYSWTLMLMVGGLFFGCWNGLKWLKHNLK